MATSRVKINSLLKISKNPNISNTNHIKVLTLKLETLEVWHIYLAYTFLNKTLVAQETHKIFKNQKKVIGHITRMRDNCLSIGILIDGKQHF